MHYYSKTTGGFYCDELHGAPGTQGSLVPPDAVEITAERHAELMHAQPQGKVIVADGKGAPIAVDPPAPTHEQLEAALTRAVQAHLDAQARALGYDDIKSAVTYAEEPAVPKFQAEGQALRAWRSHVWAACIDVLQAVRSGSRAMPAATGLIAELPAFTAP
jgi:hypothetical protein